MRLRSQLIQVHSSCEIKIWSKLIFAMLCVVLRSRVLSTHLGACHTHGAWYRRPCGGGEGRGVGGRRGAGEVCRKATSWMAIMT